jgi:hypothetical protein
LDTLHQIRKFLQNTQIPSQTTTNHANQFPHSEDRNVLQNPAFDRMSAGKPIQRGTIDAEIARRAATLLEQGERIEIMRFPFDEVVIDADSQEIVDVKKEVEQVC